MAIAPVTGHAQGVPAGGLCGAVHAGLDELERALDALAGVPGVGAGELAAAMRELTRLVNRAQALHDKGAALAGAAGVAERAGARSTGQWLAGVTGADARVAHRQAVRAEAAGLAAPTSPDGGGLRLVEDGGDGARDGQTGPGAPGAPVTVSATGRAQLAGAISREHVDVIQRALADLPDHLGSEDRERCEAELIALARGRGPRDLRRAAARVLERVGRPTAEVDAHEHAQAASSEDRAWEECSFWIRDNGDGTMHGQFTVPTLAGTTLRTILEAMASPRRTDTRRAAAPGTGAHGTGAHGTGARGVGDGGPGEQGRACPAWLDPDLDPRTRQLARQRRHGQDLATLLMRLPTDHLHDKTAATVLVTTRLSDLQDETTAVATTPTGHTLTAGEARRAACGAGIIPAVLGGDSQPIDLGRQHRFFTTTQRAALALTYDTCAAHGCDIPFAWTETHHLHAWRDGGRTDLANAVPLCGHHHRALDRGYTHTIRREGRRVVIHLARHRT